ncbi:hsp90 co-chaperone Cdc37 [Tribolium castaneum]|uniref:Hsp90 co-chaperone Cdc37 n=1 Tax=Tribolium castaneum TaxID=7070 RepID=D6WNW9_TRICA|nr:PREDICTED: hsp90 co-chaperone Cdc37 [Tribolium castaneum]EFA03198.1 Hsp90 co-chaperone Cdc37-like Protein [Tribolium castaneum]|eukprot:XP_008194349.1 PREDICTED: hsp90 co-chaperone Cdc37 [Tribolium castaneum]
MVDYSKWKNIEISDDEDETHPNIDTPSLFRWRHQARVERMEEMKKEAEEIQIKREENAKKVSQAKQKLAEAEKAGDANLRELKDALAALEKEMEAIKKKQEEHEKKEKMAPWNVDTISQPGFAKTVINKKAPRPKDEQLTDEEKESRMKNFVKENEKNLKHFGMLRRYEDSRAFLRDHLELVCEDTANYLVIWCINLEMEEKHDLMEHVAHQTICMQYILELAKQLDYDPRGCVDPFFSKIQIADPLYKKSFDDELDQFKERIRRRAAEKIEEAIKEAEEEERKARIGPGGLDQLEVLESLPENLRKCFETQDIQMLQDTIKEMDEEEANYHMKRCVAAGLWIPDAKKKEEEEAGPSDEQSKP